MRHLLALVLALAVTAASADEPGEFDYWLLALSWSPQHCSSHLGEPECRESRGFVVHGLWPQFERGYPDYCPGAPALTDRSLIERLLPLMPSEKAVRHQWRRHGSCSGMGPADYFLNVERAWRKITVPAALRAPDKAVTTTPAALEQQLVEVNPGLLPDAVALDCRGRWLAELRFCLDHDFRFRACGADVVDDCKQELVLRPLRQGGLR